MRHGLLKYRYQARTANSRVLCFRGVDFASINGLFTGFWNCFDILYFLFPFLLFKNIFFCVVLLCVVTYWVPCCDVCYNFRIKMMFGSSLPPVVCRSAHVLFILFVFVCVQKCPTHCVVFFVCFSLSCVPYAASFSVLSIFDCPFGIV